MLEARPDIVKEVTSMLQGGKANQQEKITLDKDDFDPWEAYNDPASQSYKFRQQELQESINGAVQESVQGIKKQVGMSNLQNELKSRGLGQEEIKGNMGFKDPKFDTDLTPLSLSVTMLIMNPLFRRVL